MKLIAHRGGSFGKENSLETIIESARLGADAIECDIRRTKDNVYVIYHDPYLTRLSGVPLAVSEITYNEMKTYLESSGHSLITFDELAKGYKEKAPILLHIKLTEYNEAFAEYVVSSGLPLIVGVQSLDMLKCFARLLPPEKILAFLPRSARAEDYYNNGAGIIRLWEPWLKEITPTDVKKTCPKAEVFIMACNFDGEIYPDIPLETMDGSIESLEKCKAIAADGVLLNNIEMALNWCKNIK